MLKSKFFLLIAISSFLFSCSEDEKDIQFCECLKLSKTLNEKNQQVIKETRKSDSLVFVLKELISEKRRICKPYEQMSGEEMIAREKVCE
jgi:hypothetical protein